MISTNVKLFPIFALVVTASTVLDPSLASVLLVRLGILRPTDVTTGTNAKTMEFVQMALVSIQSVDSSVFAIQDLYRVKTRNTV